MTGDTLELIDRYSTLIKKYIELSSILAEKLESFGRLRNELQLLTVELKSRNVNLDKVEEGHAPSNSQ